MNTHDTPKDSQNKQKDMPKKDEHTGKVQKMEGPESSKNDEGKKPKSPSK